MGHSCRKLLWDTLVGHSCRPLLRDISWDTLVGHSRTTLLWYTLARRSCRTLLRDTLVARILVGHHSYATLVHLVWHSLLWDTLAEHFCRTLLWDTLAKHSCIYDTLVGHSCGALLLKSPRSQLSHWYFVRDLLQKSHVKSAKQTFRTRPVPEFTCQVSKTSVWHETSSKTHTSSLQNERFV